MLAQMQAKPEVKRWLIAYSGGLDSTVLLHLAVWANQQLASPRTLCAVHINHQLSTGAGHWQQHCQQQAQALDVPIIVRSVAVHSRGLGVEAAARQARYQVFEALLTAADGLFMGHHQDDQAETLLLRLLRGAGVLGLGAMQAERRLGQGCLLRPLLGVEPACLHAYAAEHQLLWVEDQSNQSLDFDRNYLRHRVIPVLTQRWQQAVSHLAKTAVRLQASQQLLDDLAGLDLESLHMRKERCGWSIDCTKLQALHRERINNLLRFWCAQQGFDRPDAEQLLQIQRQLLQPQASAAAVVGWGQAQLRPFNQRLYLLPSLPEFTPVARQIPWDLKQDLPLSHGFYLSADSGPASAVNAISAAKIQGAACTIRWRTGGERCRPAGRCASQTLKKLLQEYTLETWLRQRVPLLYIDDQLAAVGDLWVCAEFAAQPGETAHTLKWYFAPIPEKGINNKVPH